MHRVVGTAGHINHGKTALVRALTSAETDRLPEAKRRGITIELGFAPWDLGDGLVVSIIDVPGHERFVRTMVAGASGIDAVLLVVAADDGVMPQTEEHLQVCQLLGVERGVIAITKRDVSDVEMLELVCEDVRQATTGTFLEGAPMIPCSAVTGEGIDEVRAAVRACLLDAPARGAAGPAFLPVDRVFTKAGFGTVATGTLLFGALSVGDEVEVVPGPRGGVLDGLRVRGLQVHGRAVDGVQVGTRVAMNLKGADVEGVKRGSAVAARGSRLPTSALHAEVRVLPEDIALDEQDVLSLHLGTADVLARVVPREHKRVEPGETAVVRLVCDAPLAAFAGQRLVLRKPGLSGRGIVAGGAVLDPHPRAGKGSFARWRRVAEALRAGDAPSRVRALVEDAREHGIDEAELERRLLPGVALVDALDILVRAGEVVAFERFGVRTYAARSCFDEVEGRILERVRAFHEERPMLPGFSPQEVESRLPPLAQGLARAALDRLVARRALVEREGAVALPDHDPCGGGRADALAALEARFRDAELMPPDEEAAREGVGLDPAAFRDALAELKRQARLIRVGPLHFHVSALEDLKGRVERHFASRPELSRSDFKALAGGVSRKYAIPLLEWLDARGVTTRRGDVRVPSTKAGGTG